MRPKHKTFYLAAIVCVVLAILIVGGWLFYYRIKKISQAISEADAKINFLENKEREFSKAASDLKNAEEKVKIIESVFLKENTFVEFVELLEGIARISGVNIKTESATLETSFGPASIAFTIEGGFSGIVRFFMLLDNIPVSGIIGTAEIAPKTQRGDEKIAPGMLTAQVSYIIFNFKK